MPQPDDAVVLYAEDPDELDLHFEAVFGRPAQAGDLLHIGITTWRRLADERWIQDPIAGVNFGGRRR